MRSIRSAHLVSFLGSVALLCAFEVWIVTSVWFPLNPHMLALAVTVDLTLGIPCLHYLFFVRTGRSPAMSLAPVFIASVVLANAILPSSQHTYLDHLEYLLPLLEGALLLVAALKARTTIRFYRHIRPTTVYATDALEASLRHTFGNSRLLSLLVTELLIPYYVTCGWFQRFKTTNPAHLPISYHRKSGYGSVLSMFVFLLVLETVGLHLVIQHWSSIAASVLTILSLYSLIWIIGDYHAVRLHPIVLSAEHLHIRTGLRWRIDVPWTAIAALDQATSSNKQAPGYVNVAVYGEPQLILQLKQPVIAHGLLGIEKQVSRIGLSVDDAALFGAEVDTRVSSSISR